MVLRESPIRTGRGKSVGETEEQTEEPRYVDPDGGRSGLGWRIALNDDVLEGHTIGDADELLGYLCERCYDRIVQIG